MIFEQGQLYHVYNQGNNHQRVYFGSEHYLFFLKKIREHVLPFADVLAWCLMPNHFHVMIHVRNLTRLRTASDGVTSSHPVTNPLPSQRYQTLNESIGIMLRSYTRAINKEMGRSGALFREETKAECITKPHGLTPSYFNTRSGTLCITGLPERQYPRLCFDYIHNNPVEAGIVCQATDWHYSSARDYAGSRMGSLVNKELAKEYGLV